ncbi:MAG: STAS domain-containing protein [Bacteroidales bacterium]|nr:STAS domain-containing protein [Bacteroidales bacterium]
MELEIIKKGEETIVAINGRVDTVTSPELEKGITGLLAENGISLVFDCKGMEYISSSGLRVVLSAHKKVTAGGGKFALEGLSREVKSVFDLTGFSSILTIR